MSRAILVHPPVTARSNAALPLTGGQIVALRAHTG